MIFRQVLHTDLGCASYFLADDGQAAVVDPKWDIDEYCALAAEYGVEIRHILETHNHADHVSGKGLLAAKTGAIIHVSARAGVRFPHQPLADGDKVEIGRVEVTALETPGHRPEHLAFAVADRARSAESWLLLTGDSLFVGDIARPDLAVERTEGARDVYRSLGRFSSFADGVEVWPAHVGGSLCGGAGMSKKSSSTLGLERRWNPYLSFDREEDFVAAVLAKLPPKPSNFDRIVELNRGPLLRSRWPVTRLSPQHVDRLISEGAVVVDGRSAEAFDESHIAGSVSVSLDRGAVGTRAVWAVDPDEAVIVNAERERGARNLARLLQAVGFRNVIGALAGGLEGWRRAHLPALSSKAVEVGELARRLRDGSVRLLDVREPDEWQFAHVPGALHVPCRDIRDHLDGVLANGAPLAVACATGARSALAASVLERAGWTDVVRVVGGGIPDLADYGFELVSAL